MIKRLPKPKAETHIIVEKRKYVGTCPACTRTAIETTLVHFGPPWAAMRIKLCDDCLGELREALPQRVKP